MCKQVLCARFSRPNPLISTERLLIKCLKWFIFSSEREKKHTRKNNFCNIKVSAIKLHFPKQDASRFSWLNGSDRNWTIVMKSNDLEPDFEYKSTNQKCTMKFKPPFQIIFWQHEFVSFFWRLKFSSHDRFFPDSFISETPIASVLGLIRLCIV